MPYPWVCARGSFTAQISTWQNADYSRVAISSADFATWHCGTSIKENIRPVAQSHTVCADICVYGENVDLGLDRCATASRYVSCRSTLNVAQGVWWICNTVAYIWRESRLWSSKKFGVPETCPRCQTRRTVAYVCRYARIWSQQLRARRSSDVRRMRLHISAIFPSNLL